MPNTEQISKRLFKKDLGVGDTNPIRSFFEEPFSSGVTIKPDQILSQFDLVPESAPFGMVHDEIQGVIQRKIDVSLVAVPGTSISFQHDDLKYAIPFNFGDGSYNYSVKDNIGNAIAFGQGDWVIDTYAGILTFYGSVPSNMPPKISFYKYVGDKGAGASGSKNYFIVPDIDARNAIIVGEREEGIKAYVVNIQKEYQLRGGIDNANWILLTGSGIDSNVEILTNNSLGTIPEIFSLNDEESKRLYYRADRGAFVETGTIIVEHKNGTILFTEFEGSLSNMGLAYDFNVNGSDIEMDWVVDDNVDDITFIYVVGGVVGNNGTPVGDNLGNHTATQNINLNGHAITDSTRTHVYIGSVPYPKTLGGEGTVLVERSGILVPELLPSTLGDMLKSVYDPNNVAGNAFSMGNHVETATIKHFSVTEQTKLSGIEAGAQVNHTNTDALVEGSVNLYYTEVRVSANTDVAANTAARHDHTNKSTLDSILDVGSGQIITGSERIKLIGIETGAQVNPNAATIKSLYEGNADTNAFTDADKTKLDGLESSKFLGTYLTLLALETAHPSPGAGHNGHVDAGVGEDVINYIWDVDDAKYVAQLGESTVETASSIKTKYESNANTNAFTNDEQTKLSGIEVGAQVNHANTDALVEGSTNLYYTNTRVSANVDVAANTAARHTHSNKATIDSITDAGSGIIISGAERIKLIGIETGAQVNHANTDALVEGSTNLYYTEVRVSANTDVAANTAARHTHSNKAVLDLIANEGSGNIITVPERNKLASIIILTNTDALVEGSTNLYYTEVRVSANTDVAANTAARHTHTNIATLDAVLDAGSGIIISDAERTKLADMVVLTNTDALVEGSTNLYYTEVRVSANVDVAANTAARHTHSNKATIDSITDAGSGIIISGAERIKLTGIETGAQVNQSDAEIKAQYENNADTNVFDDAAVIRNAVVQYLAAGMISSPSLVEIGTGQITIGTQIARLYDNANKTGYIKEYTIAGGSTGVDFTAIPDLTPSYVVVDYNSGSPVYDVITNVELINESNIIPVFTINRRGTTILILDWDGIASGGVNKSHARFVKTRRFEKDESIGGLGLSESAGRIINLGSGRIWFGFNPQDILAFASDIDTLYFWYHVGGVYTRSVVTQYNNTQYDNGTDLVDLNNNEYNVCWIYRAVQDNKVCAFILGESSFTLASAQASTVPATPPSFSVHYVLVGRFIVQKNATTATAIQSAFSHTFTPSANINHNDAANIQGGTDNEYYHLSATEHYEALLHHSSYRVNAKNIDYTIQPLIESLLLTYQVDNDITITIPLSTTIPNDGFIREFIVYNLGTGIGKVFVETSGTETFQNGATRIQLNHRGEKIRFGIGYPNLGQGIATIVQPIVTSRLRYAINWNATNFATPTPIPFDTIDDQSDPNILIQDATVVSRLNMLIDGDVELGFGISIASTGGVTYNVTAYLLVDGTTIIPGSQQITGNYGGEDQSLSLSNLRFTFTAGQYVELVLENASLTGYVDNVVLTAKYSI